MRLPEKHGYRVEIDGEGNLLTQYTYEPTYHGPLISQCDRNGCTTYYHFDGQGSTRRHSDENEFLSEPLNYTAFGELLTPAPHLPPFLYIGELGYYFDHELGYTYIRARSYAAWLGRWLTPDPAGFVDGPNGYAYGANNPLGRTDSTGLQTVSAENRPVMHAGLASLLTGEPKAGLLDDLPPQPLFPPRVPHDTGEACAAGEKGSTKLVPCKKGGLVLSYQGTNLESCECSMPHQGPHLPGTPLYKGSWGFRKCTIEITDRYPEGCTMEWTCLPPTWFVTGITLPDGSTVKVVSKVLSCTECFPRTDLQEGGGNSIA